MRKQFNSTSRNWLVLAPDYKKNIIRSDQTFSNNSTFVIRDISQMFNEKYKNSEIPAYAHSSVSYKWVLQVHNKCITTQHKKNSMFPRRLISLYYTFVTFWSLLPAIPLEFLSQISNMWYLMSYLYIFVTLEIYKNP